MDGGEVVNSHPQEPHPVPESPRAGRVAAVGLGTAVVLAALGAPLGWLWSAFAPDVPLVKTANGMQLTEPQPEQFVAADGWYSLLGLGFGVLAAIAVWVLLRRYRGPVTLLAVAVGTVGAALIAWWLGSRLGQDAFERLVASAPVGTTVSQPPELRAGGFEWVYGFIPTLRGDVLLPAFGAVVTYTLMAGWSRYATLVPEQEPELDAEPAVFGPRPAAEWQAATWSRPTPATGSPVPDRGPWQINGAGIDGGPGPTNDTMPGAGPWATPPAEPNGDVSSRSPAPQAPTEAPAPPVPDPAAPPRD
ncbi:hypothetical protein Prum_019640 [Phytohabitans rumicis]|uniref:DUF2567 domain-containing protein n=2 Tax=Phytohabitans rumicis TaxID=1076125 RepID=A0A6V8KT73_9ACTN|nr:hypothetical protein Prum_019640 [Phytohabitans rumicis]